MTQVTANGNTYSDDGSTSKDMGSGGYRTNLMLMLGDVMHDAQAAIDGASTASEAADTATEQAALATQAANSAEESAAAAAGAAASQVTKIGRDAVASSRAITTDDIGRLLDVTAGGVTLTFAGCATLGDRWTVIVKNSSASSITLAATGADTIDGAATLSLSASSVAYFQCDGVSLRTYQMGLSKLARLPVMQANPGWLPVSAREPLTNTYVAYPFADIYGHAGITRSASLFVLFSGSGSNLYVYTSPDGLVWTARAMPSSKQWFVGSDGTNNLVAVGYNSTATAYSSDGGITWIAGGALPAAYNVTSICRVGGLWLASQNVSETYYTSPNGSVWTARTLPVTPYSVSVNQIGLSSSSSIGVFYSSGSLIYYSSDAITWQSVDTGISSSLTAAFFSDTDGSVMRILKDGTAYRSTNGSAWNAVQGVFFQGPSAVPLLVGDVRLSGYGTREQYIDTGAYVSERTLKSTKYSETSYRGNAFGGGKAALKDGVLVLCPNGAPEALAVINTGALSVTGLFSK